MDKKYIPVMLMPFKEDRSIDYKALSELIEFYLEGGAGGLFANCLSSEMYHLTEEEMLASVAFIVQQVDKRVPIVATGTFPGSVEEQAAFVKKIYATGIDCVIVITSLLATENEDNSVFETRVNNLLSLTYDIPLGFYECPVPYKRIISAEFLGQLAEGGRITYHKDTCLDIEGIHNKLKATEKAPQFGLYDAYMAHAVDSLRAGSAGLSCIQGNYFPELVVWLCNHHAETSPELDAVQNFFVRNMDVMHATYPASAKYILKKRGLTLTTTCRNGSALGENVEPLDALLEEYEALCKILK
jgi:4-hydroxy-tetrahydrodipicolinate synthase